MCARIAIFAVCGGQMPTIVYDYVNHALCNLLQFDHAVRGRIIAV